MKAKPICPIHGPKKYYEKRRQWKCDPCRREQQKNRRKEHPQRVRDIYLKHHYGITRKIVDEKLVAQNYRCAICQRPLNDKICIDHNHENSQVRNILCDPCNLLLGQSGENIEILKRAIMYLEKWNKG